MSSASMGVSLHYDQAVEIACQGSIEKCKAKLKLIDALDRNSELSHAQVQLIHLLLHLREHNLPAASTCFKEIQSDPVVASKAMACLDSIIDADPDQIMAFRKSIDNVKLEAERQKSQRSFYDKFAMLCVVSLLISAVSILAFDPWGVIWKTRTTSTIPDQQVSTPHFNNSSTNSTNLDETRLAARGLMQDRVGKVIIAVTFLVEGGSEHVIPVASGTAYAVSADGLMITNRHVIEPGRDILENWDSIEIMLGYEGLLKPLSWELVVAFGPKESDWYSARVEKSSVYLDLAVIRANRNFDNTFEFATQITQGEDVMIWGFPSVAGEYLNSHAGNQPTIDRARAHTESLLAKSENTNLNDHLSADPGGFTLVVTRGIISAIHNAEDEQYLLTDAAIHPGNSGGPMVNSQNQVLGLVTWGSAVSETVGSAISWQTLKEELASFPSISLP